MRILVTGGAGFIGGHLAEAFVRDGADVVVLDGMDPFYDLGIREQTTDVRRRAAEAGDGAYEFVEGDVRDADISKARDLIGYEPTTTIREGVGKFVEWYRENRDWYEPPVLRS